MPTLCLFRVKCNFSKQKRPLWFFIVSHVYMHWFVLVYLPCGLAFLIIIIIGGLFLSWKTPCGTFVVNALLFSMVNSFNLSMAGEWCWVARCQGRLVGSIYLLAGNLLLNCSARPTWYNWHRLNWKEGLEGELTVWMHMFYFLGALKYFSPVSMV